MLSPGRASPDSQLRLPGLNTPSALSVQPSSLSQTPPVRSQMWAPDFPPRAGLPPARSSKPRIADCLRLFPTLQSVTPLYSTTVTIAMAGVFTPPQMANPTKQRVPNPAESQLLHNSPPCPARKPCEPPPRTGLGEASGSLLNKGTRTRSHHTHESQGCGGAPTRLYSLES